ncbi:MAG: hypothetical protein HY277_03700 [Ignavibacteriales bacterium]|nr:hypothetical protein [Ignavibacteriales bacterium]
MPHRFPNVSIIGAGIVGSTLAVALFDKGYPIVSIISRTGRAALALAKFVQCKKVSTQLEDLEPQTDLLLVTVPDDLVAEIGFRLAKIKQLRFKKLFVIHCSGVHSADVLNPLRNKGASVAAMHPVQTFPRSYRPDEDVTCESLVDGIIRSADDHHNGKSRETAIPTATNGSHCPRGSLDG